MIKQSKISADVTLYDVLDAAGVELDEKGRYLAKPYRNCASVAGLISAFDMALRAKDKQIERLLKVNAELADRCSIESSKYATKTEQLAETQKKAYGLGLDSLGIEPATRERLLA